MTTASYRLVDNTTHRISDLEQFVVMVTNKSKKVANGAESCTKSASLAWQVAIATRQNVTDVGDVDTAAVEALEKETKDIMNKAFSLNIRVRFSMFLFRLLASVVRGEVGHHYHRLFHHLFFPLFSLATSLSAVSDSLHLILLFSITLPLFTCIIDLSKVRKDDGMDDEVPSQLAPVPSQLAPVPLQLAPVPLTFQQTTINAFFRK